MASFFGRSHQFDERHKKNCYFNFMKQVGLHIIFWVIIVYWRANGDYYIDAPLEKFVWHNIVRLPPMIIATYIVIFYLLPKFIIEKKKYWTFAGLFVLNFWIAFSLDEYLIQSDLMHFVLQPDACEYQVFKQLHPFRNSFFLLSIMGLASMIRFFQLYRDKEKREYELIQEQLETQHAFLKAQVNPHFLFNALNNLYSMAIQKQEEEIAQGIESLSGIMQYLTYESSAKLVLLNKEIQLIQDYLDIQHLRTAETDDTTISFNIEGQTQDIEIAPVILLPLVENAFKHGVKPEFRCLVSIHLEIIKDQLFFKIKNTLFEKSEKAIVEKGIGLENVKKRLCLIYPDRHQIETKEEANYFLTFLQIQIR